MTDIKELLSVLNIPTYEVTHGKSKPKLPYIVFNEECNNRGSDLENLLEERSITIELYTSKQEKEIEKSIKKIFNEKGIEVKKGDSTWIDKDYYMFTPFYFDLVERIDY